jgi:hypothetical protein
MTRLIEFMKAISKPDTRLKPPKFAADGIEITVERIQTWNATYNLWPCNAVRRVTADGEGVLLNLTYQPRPCGCRVTGNGTLQFPMTVVPCTRHAN